MWSFGLALRTLRIAAWLLCCHHVHSVCLLALLPWMVALAPMFELLTLALLPLIVALMVPMFELLMLALMAPMFELLMLVLAKRVNVTGCNGMVVVVDVHGCG